MKDQTSLATFRNSPDLWIKRNKTGLHECLFVEAGYALGYQPKAVKPYVRVIDAISIHCVLLEPTAHLKICHSLLKKIIKKWHLGKVEEI